MLNKSPDTGSASADAQTKHAPKTELADQQSKAASATVVIHEPQVDWVPLTCAPLRYNSSGYIRAPKVWAENLRLKVTQFISSTSSREDLPKPEYSFRSRDWEASIDAGGIHTVFSAKRGRVVAFLHKSLGIDEFAIGGDPDEFLSSKIWQMFSPQHMRIARWHWHMVRAVLSSLRQEFGEALRNGSAHVMARKNTVLAPFEHVSWDQWQYFKLDESEPEAATWEYQYFKWAQRASTPTRWFDPKNSGWEAKGYSPSTATGPSGEKLYAIHVATGADRTESPEQVREEKCAQWIVESMAAFPERSPKARPALLKQAMSMFPGLTERGFGRALFSARRQTGNLKWITSGRRSKS